MTDTPILAPSPPSEPHRLIINCSTGDMHYETLTDEEIADNEQSARAAEIEQEAAACAADAAEAKRQLAIDTIINSDMLKREPATHAAIMHLLGIAELSNEPPPGNV